MTDQLFMLRIMDPFEPQELKGTRGYGIMEVSYYLFVNDLIHISMLEEIIKLKIVVLRKTHF